MCEEPGFWWNWWVAFGGAIATFLAVLAALFNPWFQARYFPGVLRLSLLDGRGEACPARFTKPWQNGPAHEVAEWTEHARFYHLRITNARRRSPVNETLVYLSKLEERDGNGNYVTVWTGDLPLRWRHAELFTTARVVGPQADCDLCGVVSGQILKGRQPLHDPALKPRFSLYPQTQVNNLSSYYERSEPVDIILTLQARSNEIDSSTIRVHIQWDGKWVTDENPVEHLNVSII